ncbi:DUF2514 family protein [Rubrivivax rivuli]|uniref:DUF2514 family protein n=1 Tax=Rubrivivax rivuli TaxID=1862385 RepID=UPI0013E379E2|nr:DUF2514 family protein [Rubrivivax rivuli]
MTAWLRLVPSWAWVALLALPAALWWGAERYAAGDRSGAARVQVVLERERGEWANERAAAAEVSRLAARAVQIEEQRRRKALQEALDDAERVAQQERADRVVADAVAGRLHDRIAALVTAARFAARNSGATLGGPAAEDAPGMLADVLGQCIARARLLADVADARGRAGALCERAHDALTVDGAAPAQ